MLIPFFSTLGSPFHPRIVDARKVRAIGGWESLCDSAGRLELSVHNTKKISLDTSEAGPGKLQCDLIVLIFFYS